jgi:Holliday junction resolvase
LVNHYLKGVRAERAAIKELKENDYLAIRSSASRSPIDVIGIDINHTRLIQVKNYKRRTRGNYSKWIKELEELKPFVHKDVKVELWLFDKGKFEKIVI